MDDLSPWWLIVTFFPSPFSTLSTVALGKRERKWEGRKVKEKRELSVATCLYPSVFG